MKRKIDKTSIVMTILFFAIIIGAVLGCGAMIAKSKTATTPENTEEIPAETEQTSRKMLYETPEELVDRFKEVCVTGDIDALYELYYDDYLTKMRENAETEITKEKFDASIINEMLSVTGVDIYNYGDVEMPATQSPASYANYIYHDK